MTLVSTRTDPDAAEGIHASSAELTDAGSSTSALVVEVSLLRYALRARAARDAGGSAAAADAEFRTLLRRRDALLAHLRRRGVDFGDADRNGPGSPEQQDPSTPVERTPRQEQAAPVLLVDLVSYARSSVD